MKFSKNKLEEVANNSLYTTFTNAKTIDYSFEIFTRYFKGGDILELGPAEGLMTERLRQIGDSLTVIEGSEVYSKALAEQFDDIKVINALFEDAELVGDFDAIVLGHVLEHVENADIILSKIKRWLKPGGIIFCAVPNARSIHRQAAVEMGLIKSIFAMSEKDKHHGHMRIYSPETLMTEFVSAGFNVLNRGGYWLKPISDGQIDDSWSKEMLDAFMKLGEFYPDIAAEIYVVATL